MKYTKSYIKGVKVKRSYSKSNIITSLSPNASKLFIVESIVKSKTISKLLGEEFDVLATYGHISNLDKKDAFDNVTYEPKYEYTETGKLVFNYIEKNIKKYSVVYIATDPDREGEAIAFSIWNIVESYKKGISKRVLLHEINKDALNTGIDNALDSVNELLVYSQQTRRIIDRVIGFKLSFSLWRYLIINGSAGRVQTVALKAICEREIQRRQFINEISFSLNAVSHSKKTQLGIFKSYDEALNTLKAIEKSPFTFSHTLERNTKYSSFPPLKTSTLQQMSFKLFSFSASKTSSVAQSLFEGLKIYKDTKGLITYTRTDSTRVSSDFLEKTKLFLNEKFTDVVMKKVNVISKKELNIQDAHECIRPTDLYLVPETIKEYLTKDQYSLYSLIYYSFLASMLDDIVFKRKVYVYKYNDMSFELQNITLKSLGFCILGDVAIDMLLPDFEKIMSVSISCKELNDTKEIYPVFDIKEIVSQPLPHFNESTLIAFLEDKGIGRPSTYSTILPKLDEKKYIKGNKSIESTEMGDVINSQMKRFFEEIFDFDFTFKLETQLNEIALGNLAKQKFLKEFLDTFEIKNQKYAEVVSKLAKKSFHWSNSSCFTCDSILSLQFGPFGPFVICEKDHKFAISYNLINTMENILSILNSETNKQYGKRKDLFSSTDLPWPRSILNSLNAGHIYGISLYNKSCSFLLSSSGAYCLKCKSSHKELKIDSRIFSSPLRSWIIENIRRDGVLNE